MLTVWISLVLSAAEPSSASVFEKRILPILNSPNPSSCTQCHLAAVDLKNYILPTAQRTFASLRDRGLVDLDKPENSKILALIARGSDDRRAEVKLSQQARDAELAAFTDWIKSAAADPAMRGLPKADEADRAEPGVEVVRHTRIDRVLSGFESTVWAMRFRCAGCHTQGAPGAAKYAAEFGEGVYWIRKDGAAATLAYLAKSKLVDRDRPEKSLLLAKPLNTVKHAGGQKFSVGDEGYKAFRTWLEDFAAVESGRIRSATDIPKPAPAKLERFGTEINLKLTDLPAEWVSHALQVRVYARASDGSWESDPIAVAERPVVGGHGWHQSLMLVAPVGSDRAAKWKAGKAALAPGRYLLKVRVDLRDRLAADWRADFGDAENVGQLEFEPQWTTGWAKPSSVSVKSLRK